MKRAIIVDDEQAAVDKLGKMLRETGCVEVSAVFTGAFEAESYVRSNHVDLAFLDIDMPKLSGLELADRFIDMNSKIKIVFVTAYSEYAVEAFRLHALDYLLKPVNRERLDNCLGRIGDETVAAPEETAPPEAPLSGESEIKGMVNVHCFGRFRVDVGGTSLKFRTAKAEELFEYLAGSNGAPVSRNHIIDLFWEDYDGDHALVLFNTTLHYLKRAFIEKGVRLGIEYHRGGYRLDMRGISCDALQFAQFTNGAQPISKHNISEFLDAAAMYRGDYLEQSEYHWAMQTQVDLKERYVRLILRICDFYKKEGSTTDVIHLIQTALARDPVNRFLNLRLLEAFRERGDTVSMKRYYQLYKDKLIKEYGMEPGEELRQIMSGI